MQLPEATFKLLPLLGRLALQQISSFSVPSLEQLIVRRQVSPGQLFTFESRFNSSGLAGRESGGPVVRAHLRQNLKEFGDDRVLEIPFSTEHILSSTGYGQLMGRPSVFVYAYIRDVSKTIVCASPFVIGDLMSGDAGEICVRYREDCRVSPQQIDVLGNVNFLQRLSTSSLSALRAIPKKEIKAFFAHLVGIEDPEKDWGGERSDLFTPNLEIEGIRMDAAWMLKGPAAFHPMALTDCGKKADQIERLFDEPAELFIVQHCHKILPAVRKIVAAFARSRAQSNTHYCLIDGFDTWRILRHFKKI